MCVRVTERVTNANRDYVISLRPFLKDGGIVNAINPEQSPSSIQTDNYRVITLLGQVKNASVRTSVMYKSAVLVGGVPIT